MEMRKNLQASHFGVEAVLIVPNCENLKFYSFVRRPPASQRVRTASTASRPLAWLYSQVDSVSSCWP